MTDAIKKRELLNPHPDNENPMLQDIINDAVKISGDLAKLEYNDNKTAASNVISGLIEVEKTVKRFKGRMKLIKEEIMKSNSGKRSNRPDNTKFLPGQGEA